MGSSRASTDTWAPGMPVPGTSYRVVRPLGKGGMGEVYEVEHNMLGTRRALKVLARHFAGRDDLAERLLVEARGLARLKHPNLVEVYDLGTATDGRIYFVMELLNGCTLRDLLRRRVLSPRVAVRLVAQILDGLHVAHAAQLIHRDIKPENIFVCRTGITKLLDFGVAKTIDAWMPAQNITGAGMTVGTPRYMAPEQAEAKPVDARADVYAAGLVLWEALVGRSPFEESDPVALVVSKMTKGVPPLELQGAEFPQALCTAVMTACSIDPQRRQRSAAQFALEIRRAVGENEQPWAVALTPQPEPLAIDTVAEQATVEPTVRETPNSHEQTTHPDRPAAVQRTALADTRVAPTAQTERACDGVHRELTEQIDAVAGLDPDAPTRTSVEHGPALVGPTGTQMLPAVAAQHCPTVAAEPPISSSQMSQRAPRRSPSADTPSAQPSGPAVWVQSSTGPNQPAGPSAAPRSTRWGLTIAAFAVPVLLAAAFGLLRMRSISTPQPLPTFAQPSVSVAAQVASEPSAVASAPAAAAASSPAPASTSAVSTVVPSPAKTSGPTKVSTGIPTSTAKTKPPTGTKAGLPASGL